jgi:hypothetical protein
MKHGVGTLHLSNNEKVSCEFTNNLLHGRGKFYSKSGDVVHAIWVNNKLSKIL